MTQEIVTHEEKPVTVQGTNIASLFSMAVEAARDPNIDATKMELLVRLATDQQDREAQRRFRIAKQRALLDMPSISRHGSIVNHKTGQVQSRYSKFEDIHRIVKPILESHKLSISFVIGHEGQLTTVQPILAYADDEVAYEERGGEMVLATDTTGSKNATQGAGSAASYGKRHTLKATLNIIEGDEDDDGQGTAEALPADRVKLIDDAREAAVQGTEAYRTYFTALSKEDQGFLAYAIGSGGEPYHEQNKKAAALYD